MQKNANSRLFLFHFLLVISLLVTGDISAKESEKPKLSDFKLNVFSQWGEDGIIQKIFNIIGVKSKICVEFGAADGFYFSNTANLWSKDPSWKAVLIECDPKFFSQLVTKVKN